MAQERRLIKEIVWDAGKISIFYDPAHGDAAAFKKFLEEYPEHFEIKILSDKMQISAEEGINSASFALLIEALKKRAFIDDAGKSAAEAILLFSQERAPTGLASSNITIMGTTIKIQLNTEHPNYQSATSIILQAGGRITASENNPSVATLNKTQLAKAIANDKNHCLFSEQDLTVLTLIILSAKTSRAR